MRTEDHLGEPRQLLAEDGVDAEQPRPRELAGRPRAQQRAEGLDRRDFPEPELHGNALEQGELRGGRVDLENARRDERLSMRAVGRDVRRSVEVTTERCGVVARREVHVPVLVADVPDDWSERALGYLDQERTVERVDRFAGAVEMVQLEEARMKREVCALPDALAIFEVLGRGLFVGQRRVPHEPSADGLARSLVANAQRSPRPRRWIDPRPSSRAHAVAGVRHQRPALATVAIRCLFDAPTGETSGDRHIVFGIVVCFDQRERHEPSGIVCVVRLSRRREAEFPRRGAQHHPPGAHGESGEAIADARLVGRPETLGQRPECDPIRALWEHDTNGRIAGGHGVA